MENKKIRLVIDADSLTYQNSKDTIEESIQKLKNSINYIFANTNADEYIMCVSSDTCFRYDIYPEYKSNRKNKVQPLKYIKTLKALLKEEYNALEIQNYEADDVVATLRRIYHNDENLIVCSIDKDVLYSCVGKTYDYKKSESSITTQEFADEFFFYQMLAGDAADNIKGLRDIKCLTYRERLKLGKRKGVGDVTAKKILKLWEEDEIDNSQKFRQLKYLYFMESKTNYKFNINSKLIRLEINDPKIIDYLNTVEFNTVNRIESENYSQDQAEGGLL